MMYGPPSFHVDAIWLGLIALILQLLPPVGGILSPFTKVPPSVLYVVNGTTARFVWDYYVVDKNTAFAGYSPTWYYHRNTTRVQIAYEYKWSNPKWKWIIAPSCPDSLEGRISKESTATLVISGVTTANSGTYRCQLMFSNGISKSSQVKLVVTVSPRFLINPPSSVVVSESSTLSLSCSATGQPTPNVTWVKKRGNVVLVRGLGKAALLIFNIKKDQNGTYECKASNNPTENPINARTMVIVQYPPSITIAPKATNVVKGDQITLICRANGNPTPTISWSKERGVIKPVHMSGNTLIIPNAVKNDAGKYICTAINFYGRTSHAATASAYVAVKYPPTIFGKSQRQIFNETGYLRLSCTADGYPPPNITWTKSPGTITPSVTTGNVYSISSVKRSDAGTYRCRASNGIGIAAIANTQVTVYYKAEIEVSKSTKTTDSWNGKHIVLLCSFTGNPAPRVLWYKPSGSEITTSTRTTTSIKINNISSELNITTTTAEDYGKYRCVVRNLVGGSEYYFLVNQLFTPYHPKDSHAISDSKGTQATVFWCVPEVKGGTTVIDYKVEINTNPPRDIITKDTFVEIKDLKENTEFVVSVSARNIAGYGDPVSKIILTTNPENHTTFIIASLVTILGISLLANMLFIITFVKTQRAGSKLRATKRYIPTSYENKNDVEMDSMPASSRPSQTNMSKEGCTQKEEPSHPVITDDSSHYQTLSSATRRPVEATPQKLYEPLQVKDENAYQSQYASLQLKNLTTTKIQTLDDDKA